MCGVKWGATIAVLVRLFFIQIEKFGGKMNINSICQIGLFLFKLYMCHSISPRNES